MEKTGFVWKTKFDLGGVRGVLRSRYYFSLIGKFINMDNVIGTNKALLNNHLFAYARNNPIMYIDSSGQWCERIACWLASGEMKEKNFVEGDRLYTGRGEVYQLNRPLTGTTNGAEYQKIASGKASSSFFLCGTSACNAV